MKNVCIFLWGFFTILTLIGAGYIFYKGGNANAGFACVPMVFCLAFGAICRKYKRNAEKASKM